MTSITKPFKSTTTKNLFCSQNKFKFLALIEKCIDRNGGLYRSVHMTGCTNCCIRGAYGSTAIWNNASTSWIAKNIFLKYNSISTNWCGSKLDVPILYFSMIMLFLISFVMSIWNFLIVVCCKIPTQSCLLLQTDRL